MEPARQQPRAHDEQSFERLYRQHRAEIYRALLRELGNREDAEDVTQTAFLDAYRALARGTEPTQPRAWLYTIAENARRRRFRALDRRAARTELGPEPAAAVAQVTVLELRDALAGLPANQRATLVLREVGGLSYAEIAARLDLSVAAVQMLLFRARRTVRAELGEDGPLRRAGALLPWPVTHWLGRLVSDGGAASLVPSGLGVAAAGVASAVVVVAAGAPTPIRPASLPEPPAVAARVAILHPAVRTPAALPAAAHTPRTSPVPAIRQAPAPRTNGAPTEPAPLPAVDPAPPPEPAAVAVAPPELSEPPAASPPPLAVPSVEAPQPAGALLAPVVETVAAAVPPVRSPAPLHEALVPRLPELPPTDQSPTPAPPAGGVGDFGGAALPGLPPS